MIGWHHQLNEQESEQTPGDGEGQGSLVCCSPGVAKSQTQLSDKPHGQYDHLGYCQVEKTLILICVTRGTWGYILEGVSGRESNVFIQGTEESPVGLEYKEHVQRLHGRGRGKVTESSGVGAERVSGTCGC